MCHRHTPSSKRNLSTEVVLIYVENSFTCFFAIFFPGFFGQIVLLSFSKSRKNSDRKIFIKFMTNKFKTTSQKSLPNLRQLIFCRLLKKVFFALPWVENVEVFQDSRTTDSTHFLYRQRIGSASSGPPSIYLSECEALSRYCCHGLFHSLPLNNRTSGLTLFCM